MNYKIYTAQLKLNWFKKKRLKRIIYKNLDRHLLCLGDIKSTYQQNDLLHKLPEFSFFETKLNVILQKTLNANIKIGNMWANVGSHGSKVSPHNHVQGYDVDNLFKTCGICGAYYLQKPKLSGNFIAHGDVINVKEGGLIFFSPHMTHQTEVNFSKKDRIVISFNGCLTPSDN